MVSENTPTVAVATQENAIETTWGKGTPVYIIDIDTVPDPDWIVEGVVLRQGLTLIWGDSQMGKTIFSLHLIDSMQTGMPFFGRSAKFCKVLIIEQDQSPSTLKDQKVKLGKPAKLWAVKLPIKWDNAKKKFNGDLEAMLTSCRPDVIIIDALTSLGIEDINHPSIGLIFDELRLYSQTYDCAFVILHHANKTGDQMGSNLNYAKMDSVIGLHKSNKQFVEEVIPVTKGIVARQEKLKAAKCEDIEISFNTKTLQMTLYDDKTSKDKVRKFLQESKSVEEILALMPDDKPDTIRKYYRDIPKGK